MEFNYYYGDEAEQFSFIRIPKLMLTDKKFEPLSLAAKLLYGLLLDRMSLSVKNGWLDEEKRVYIIFKIEEIQDILGFSKRKSIDYLNELEEFGLVEKKRRGLGLPSIIYVKSFMLEEDCASANIVEMGTSRGARIDTSGTSENECVYVENSVSQQENTKKCDDLVKNESKIEDFCTESCVRSAEYALQEVSICAPQEVSICAPLEVRESAPLKSNTKYNNTNINNTDSNPILSDDDKGTGDEIGLDEISACADRIKTAIEYDILIERYPYDAEIINGILDLIIETIMSNRESIVIASDTYPIELVRNKFSKLSFEHIEYAIGCLKNNTTKVRNIKKYMLAILFNAPSTSGGYYRAELNHDMPQFAG